MCARVHGERGITHSRVVRADIGSVRNDRFFPTGVDCFANWGRLSARLPTKTHAFLSRLRVALGGEPHSLKLEERSNAAAQVDRSRMDPIEEPDQNEREWFISMNVEGNASRLFSERKKGYVHSRSLDFISSLCVSGFILKLDPAE